MKKHEWILLHEQRIRVRGYEWNWICSGCGTQFSIKGDISDPGRFNKDLAKPISQDLREAHVDEDCDIEVLRRVLES